MTTRPKQAYVGFFESLGDNCELAIVQREYGFGATGLLSWVGSNDFAHLIDALKGRFEGLGEPAFLGHRLLPGWVKYAAIDLRYGLYFHTDFSPSDDPSVLESMAAKEVARFRFLRAKMLATLTEGNKIFVFNRKKALTEQELASLCQALAAYGDHTKLLYVQESSERLPGDVDKINDRLYYGYIDNLSAIGYAGVNFQAWSKILARTYLRSMNYNI